MAKRKCDNKIGVKNDRVATKFGEIRKKRRDGKGLPVDYDY